MRKTIIGVMGPGDNPTQGDLENAQELGRLIAEEGWMLLTGGMAKGVMDRASKGAAEAGGEVIGISMDSDSNRLSEHVTIPVLTGMGTARNKINILSSDVVIACGIGLGTVTEIAYAIKEERPVILLNDDQEAKAFFRKLGGENITVVDTPEDALNKAKKLV